MLTNSQKEHLTYTLVGQVLMVVGLGIVAYQYIFPGMSFLKEERTLTQGAVDTHQSTLTDGIPNDVLQQKLSGKVERAELVKIIQSDPKGAQEIIKKTPGVSRDYLDWLKGEIGKSDDEKKDLIKEKAKLNSIIPTMSPLSNNIEENNISLRQYVSYIEKSILRRFNFDSNVVIGMQGITFGNGKQSGVPETIGMFDFRLDFKATNRDILDFIEYINESGEPTILSYTGTLKDADIPRAMSNPLITMEAFSVQDRLDEDNPTKENTGRATLRFYVRGISVEDLSFLRSNLKEKQTALEKRIGDSVKACQKDGLICASYGRKLNEFERKYQEYSRSLSNAKIATTGTDEIFVLAQSASTLKTLEEELSEILPKK